MRLEGRADMPQRLLIAVIACVSSALMFRSQRNVFRRDCSVLIYPFGKAFDFSWSDSLRILSTRFNPAPHRGHQFVSERRRLAK
jgi:hypothetical protein